jgi:hypothetical protein
MSVMTTSRSDVYHPLPMRHVHAEVRIKFSASVFVTLFFLSPKLLFPYIMQPAVSANYNSSTTLKMEAASSFKESVTNYQ